MIETKSALPIESGLRRLSEIRRSKIVGPVESACHCKSMSLALGRLSCIARPHGATTLAPLPPASTRPWLQSGRQAHTAGSWRRCARSNLPAKCNSAATPQASDSQQLVAPALSNVHACHLCFELKTQRASVPSVSSQPASASPFAWRGGLGAFIKPKQTCRT